MQINNSFGSLIPESIEKLNDCLSECSQNDMSPLTEKLLFQGPNPKSLAFFDFVSAIAYPIQSYAITNQEKWRLMQRCQQLYPEDASSSQEFRHTWSLLRAIFKRIVLAPACEIPVGLDLLRPPSPVTVSFDFELLEKKEIFLEGNRYVSLGRSSLEMPLDERSEMIAKMCGIKPKEIGEKIGAEYKMKQLSALLNHLYFEARLMIALAKKQQMLRLDEVCCRRFWQISQGRFKLIRITADQEVMISEKEFECESREEFATALQYRRIETQRNLLSEDQGGSKEKSELARVCESIREIKQARPSLFADWAEAFFLKEVSFFDRLKALEELLKLKNFYYRQRKLISNLAALDIRAEDILTPFSSRFLKKIKEVEQKYAKASVAFAVPQGNDPQDECDFDALCSLYDQHRTAQSALYAFFYQELAQLVSKKDVVANHRKWMKVMLIEEEEKCALPEELPSFHLYGASSEFQEQKAGEKETGMDIDQLCDLPLDGPVKGEEESLLMEQPQNCGSASSALPPCLETDKSGGSFLYAARVSRWFEAKQVEVLDPFVFPEYQDYPLSYQKTMIDYHAFSPLVDIFIQELGVKQSWENPRTGHLDCRYILPAEMEKEQKRVRGVIVYCIGRQDRLYHRFFSPKPTEEIIRKIAAETFRDIDFPELTYAGNDEEGSLAEQLTALVAEEEEVKRDPYLGTITINNKKRGVLLSLFAVRAQTKKII